MYLKILIILVLSIQVYAGDYKKFNLSFSQYNVLKKVYNIGLQYKAKDGFSFEKTLASIYMQESSAGENIIGDQYTKTGKIKTLYESSLGAGQIQLRTAQIVLNKYPKLKQKYSYLIHENIYSYNEYIPLLKNVDRFKTILNNPRWLNDTSKKGRDTISWAKKELIQAETLLRQKYWEDIKKDNLLINKLLTDVEFSATISVHYLIMNYETSIQLGKKNPYFSTISRYNGGWNNVTYYQNIMHQMRNIIKPLFDNI